MTSGSPRSQAMPTASETAARHGAIELVEGRLWALGGVIPIDGRVSWIASGVVGFAPLHCYLLRDDDRALLIDSGAPVHFDQIRAQLDALVPGGTALSLVLTRTVEFDTFGNAAAVLRRFPLVSAHSQFPIEEWVYYRPLDDREPRRSPVEWHPLLGGQSVGIGGVGALSAVEIIDAPLRLLVTVWVYDPATRVLFTSDSFGHSAMPDAAAAPVLDASVDATTFEDVREHVLAKFDWLGAANTGPIRQQLADIFESRQIDLIAPVYGRPLAGPELVQRHYALLQRALAEVGADSENSSAGPT